MCLERLGVSVFGKGAVSSACIGRGIARGLDGLGSGWWLHLEIWFSSG